MIESKVFYTWEQSQNGELYDPGFGIHRKWDIPLLDGYTYSFVRNTSSQPGSHRFRGIVNPSLIKDVKEFSPDVLLVYGWSFWSHLKLMWYFHGKVPVYFRGDSTLLDETQVHPVKKMIRRLFLRSIYLFVDKALYAGSDNRNYFLKHGLKDHQLYWVPHAIDNNRFGRISHEDQVKVSAWRKELGFKEADCVFLFAGKLESKKNPSLLIDAFLNLSQENAGLIIAGNGELEQELKKKVQDKKGIVFLPFQNQNQMPLIYRVADVFVLPSSGPGETWGLAVNEAMASGRAVVVSDRCGCASDLVKDNGYVFEAGNKQQLASILQSFVEQPSLKVEMGFKSKELIEQWSFSTAAQRIEEVLCR